MITDTFLKLVKKYSNNNELANNLLARNIYQIFRSQKAVPYNSTPRSDDFKSKRSKRKY
jgi:hypothetical protein